MHVALTGGSGFIGSAVARRLEESGHTVTALVRPESRRDVLAGSVDRFVVGDHADRRIWPELLDGAECVIHNSVDWTCIHENDLQHHLASNLVGSIGLLHAAGERQFVFMSTIAVHHEMRPRWGGVIDEDHPLRPNSLYGAAKAAMEEHLWAAHFHDGVHTCALRPCAVYGIDPRLERSIGYPIIERLRRNKSFTRPGGGKFVHVEDVAKATVAAVGNPAAAGKVYNLVDCYARWADLALMVSALLGIDAEIDDSSPLQPKNTFTKDAVQSLGVSLDRGHSGLREHLRELIERMDGR